MVPKETDKVERFIWGLPDSIKGNETSSTPMRLQEGIQIANSLMDQKNVVRAYTAGSNEKRGYAGTLPLCNKCKLHHNGSCTMKYRNCKMVGHMARVYRSPTVVADQRTLICFECGNQGHYHNECPKLKNKNRVNQARKGEAHGRVYALRGGEADQDPNNIKDDVNA
ncbi:reverse transcriptase domain-containing protein [Tanacetum coccineum]